MHKNLEEAFDANAFVIAPAAVPEKNQPVEWKIVLTKKFAKLTIFDNTSYGGTLRHSINTTTGDPQEPLCLQYESCGYVCISESTFKKHEHAKTTQPSRKQNVHQVFGNR